MTIEQQHKKDVETLQKLEEELVELIADSDKEELQNKFMDWQEQRQVCNEGYLKLVKSIRGNAVSKLLPDNEWIEKNAPGPSKDKSQNENALLKFLWVGGAKDMRDEFLNRLKE